MDPSAWIAVCAIVATVILCIFAHIAASVFWAGNMNAKINVVMRRQEEIAADVKNFQATCFTKEDAAAKSAYFEKENTAMWKRIDELRLASGLKTYTQQ